MSAEVARQDRRLDVGEVDHHQRVKRVAKRRVDVEREELGVETEILAEEDRNSLAVRLLTDKSMWRRFSRAAAVRARELFDVRHQARALELYYDRVRG